MKNKRGLILITLGLLLIAAALGLTAYNIWDEYRVTEAADNVAYQLLNKIEAVTGESALEIDKQTVTLELPIHVQNPTMEMPIEHIDGWDYIGVLEIPAYDLTLPIISQWSNAALRVSPARYDGSVYTNDLIISAHNYNSHFGHLKNLVEGDEIKFTDMSGNVFFYEVVLRETLMPTAVAEMKSGNWDLTLFTCTLGGQYRVTIRCERVEDTIHKQY